MSIVDNLKGRRPPRQEPPFEGDRQAKNLGEITREIDERDYRRPNRASDFAQPEVRQAVANLEEEISGLTHADLSQQEAPTMTRARDIGNSTDMQKAKQIVENTITAAHASTAKALDSVVAEIQALADRAKRDVEAYKTGLESGGQEIAVKLEATMQTITRTVEWIEKHTPDLRNPKLEPAQEKPADTESDRAS